MTTLRPTRILIVKLSSLGGMFHALPTVHALKTGLNAVIDWVVQPEYAELVGCFTDVKDVLLFPRHSLIEDFPDFFRELSHTRYDYVIDLQGLMKSAVITVLAHGKKKIGPSTAREGAQFFYHEVAGKQNRNRHAVEEMMDVVRHLHLPVPETAEFPVQFPVHPGLGGGLQIALCPASDHSGKNWPPERFIEVARQLRQRTGAAIHLIGDAASRPLCEKLAAEIGPGTRNDAGELAWVELGSLLKEMSLLITVDSSPMHIATATDTPTLALFGPNPPLRTGPYGKRHGVIASPFNPGKRTFSKKALLNDPRYMQAIAVEPVLKKALELLEQTKPA